jgi:hypothetical protein
MRSVETPAALHEKENSMDILQKIDQYRALLDRKDELADRTKEVNLAIQTCRDELAGMMIEAETPKVSREGYGYSVTQKVKYTKAAGVDAELMEALRENGLGDIIRETVNAQTLQGAMSNLAEENDGELPEEFRTLIRVYEFYDVSRRKERAK